MPGMTYDKTRLLAHIARSFHLAEASRSPHVANIMALAPMTGDVEKNEARTAMI